MPARRLPERRRRGEGGDPGRLGFRGAGPQTPSRPRVKEKKNETDRGSGDATVQLFCIPDIRCVATAVTGRPCGSPLRSMSGRRSVTAGAGSFRIAAALEASKGPELSARACAPTQEAMRGTLRSGAGRKEVRTQVHHTASRTLGARSANGVAITFWRGESSGRSTSMSSPRP